ncbi:sodium:solute symporter [Burkholderia sp. USMB20]|uniref:sodium:solute symporter n=1 Tax=Burkholderia sp. USMB20 TaxID=1571773 RepID=UPI0005CDD46A|nr:sodium:solute symporter [Burkholderia sp. USMB20]TGN95673.1 sodium:solute symporter [Burkholderia sp. USMB20]
MTQLKLGAVGVGSLLVSASYGVAFLLGSGEMAVHAGMAGSLYAIVTALGMLALAAPTLWRTRELIWDVFGDRYGTVVRKLVALLSLVWMSGVLAAQIHGGIAVLVAMGLPAMPALAVIAAGLLIMSSLELGMAATVFVISLLVTNIALVHALVASNGLPVYLHAWPSFASEVRGTPRAETLVTIAAVGFLVITGSDYQQFVIAARRPRDAWLGCVLAGLFLTATGFLPAAAVVAALHAGRLSGLHDSASAIPSLILQTGGPLGPLCIGVILLAALGSGSALTRAMACALEGVVKGGGHRAHYRRILIIAIGSAIAADGQAIVSTIVSLNVVYVAAVGLLFILHETGLKVPPRCATMMLLAGAGVSLLVAAIHWTGIFDVAGWLPLPAGLLASSCMLLTWQIMFGIRRVRA